LTKRFFGYSIRQYKLTFSNFLLSVFLLSKFNYPKPFGGKLQFDSSKNLIADTNYFMLQTILVATLKRNTINLVVALIASVNT